MARVDDVAAGILDRTGPVDTFKLQKLVYYSQAWHLVWEDEPLFDEMIEAWANGPVVRKLYNRHRGAYSVSSWKKGDSARLADHEGTTLDAVVAYYGGMKGVELAELTHREDPWRLAREGAGLRPGDRGNVEIPLASMAEYYGSLVD